MSFGVKGLNLLLIMAAEQLEGTFIVMCELMHLA
jgi:hypothetical protein